MVSQKHIDVEVPFLVVSNIEFGPAKRCQVIWEIVKELSKESRSGE
jgi:hypothetical protein